jgi:hypothetical protein
LPVPSYLQRGKPNANRGIEGDASLKHAVEDLLESCIFKLDPQM